MTLNIRKILAIIDPTTDKQWALSRALNVARQVNAAVQAYVCCYSSVETEHFLSLKRAEIARHAAWLNKIIEDENVDGISITTEVEWREDWRDGIANAARAFDADLVVKAAFEHSAPARLLLKTSDWTVLRNAISPVLLVKNDPSEAPRCVLIAVNPRVEDEKHRRLNDDIISIGKQIARGNARVSLHAVSAYTGSEAFTTPPELAELVGIEEDHAHCSAGPPDGVIVECANLVHPDLVVIGTVSRSGLSGLAKPNTAERALDRLESDVLVIGSAN